MIVKIQFLAFFYCEFTKQSQDTRQNNIAKTVIFIQSYPSFDYKSYNEIKYK